MDFDVLFICSKAMNIQVVIAIQRPMLPREEFPKTLKNFNKS